MSAIARTKPNSQRMKRMLKSRSNLLTIATASLCVAVMLLPAAPARSQSSTYPEKPITLVVPFPAGGATDAGARLFARYLGDALGQPLVVDNRAGAAGTIGSAYVSRANPDGYTLLWGSTSTLAVAPNLYKNTKYDVHSFIPLGMALRGPMMLAGNPALEAKDLTQLITLAKKRPLTVGTAGSGSLGHLAAEYLRESAGVQLSHVPYRGGNPAITDALGGQTDLVLDTASALAPYVRSNKLRAYAVTGAKPYILMPEVPLMKSAVPSYEVYAWFGPFAPAGTPPAIVQRLVDAMAKVSAMPAVKKELAALGVEPGVQTPRQFAEVIQADGRKWSEIISRAGVRPGE